MDEELKKSRKTVYVLLALAVILTLLGIVLIWVGMQNKPSLREVVESSPGQQKDEVEKPPFSGLEGEEVIVTRVIDGDTIEVEGGRRVRYIGIDTPETVDPRRPVGCFGKEAAVENKKLVEGKKVMLVKDVSEADKFGRLLRYIYVADQDQLIFVNDYLVRQGFAQASTFPPDVKFNQEFIEAEREARDNQRGLWERCNL